MDEIRGRATLAHRDLARRILELELGSDGTSTGLADAAEAACTKLSSCFIPIITRSGTDALIARALYLSRLDFALLNEVTAGGAGEPCLKGLREKLQGAEDSDATEAILAILANAIALLSTFIGDVLVMRKLNATWPEVFHRAGLSREET